MNEMAYVFQAWLPLIVWQQIDAPEYRKGYITVTIISGILILTAFTIRHLHQRQIRSKHDVVPEVEDSGIDRSGAKDI